MPAAQTSSSCVYNIPMALDPATFSPKGLDPEFGKARNREHFRDSKEYILGPIPPTKFIEHFLPYSSVDTSGFRSSTRAFSRVPLRGRGSSDIYEPLVTALNDRTKHRSRCPGFVFHSPYTGPPRPHGVKVPHVCCYAADNLALVQATPGVELGYAELFIQVNPDPTRDFFVDPPSDVDEADRPSHNFLACPTDWELRQKLHDCLGQHISHAVEVFARQHRLFVFTISMFGSYARFLRWDRAGCVVSESFNIRERPDLLCEMLWRFAAASDVQRGHDPTVELALAEEPIFMDAIKRYVRSQIGSGQDADQAIKLHYEPGHVVAIQVLHHRFTATSENTRRFLVSRPVVTPLAMVGRGTRGYWAVDTTTDRVVFLKDTWRHTSLLEVEGETLRRLNDLGVRNIPSLVWHGDVPKGLPEVTRKLTQNDLQSTGSDQFVSFPGICQVDGENIRTSKRHHYRLVMGTVGSPLKTVRGAKELLHAAYDVFTAMRDALAKDSRIHRDISVANIILVQEGDSDVRRGYLIDWDASCRVDDAGDAVEEGRAGTWKFMSIRMLHASQAYSKQTIQDDMESLLYVVLYCALLWLPHNFSQQELTSTVSAFFDESYKHTLGVMQGGAAKFANAKRRQYTLLLVFGSPAFQDWLLTVQNYHSPLAMHGNKYEGKWSDPDQLDAYWSSFLQTRTLEVDNRVEHELDMFDHYGLISPSTIFSLPRSPLPGPARRKRQSRVEPAPPRAKPSSALAATSSGLPASTGPKRSKRIQKQEETKQSVASRKPATVPAARPAAKGKGRVAAPARK
ncbi:hypothetical protein C8T65DRAFT_645395 [Cerioporus squamosus]|nr:hypothetical protein C8T65DRAFT_645395 [Cerioporus squamosus]